MPPRGGLGSLLLRNISHKAAEFPVPVNLIWGYRYLYRKLGAIPVEGSNLNSPIE
jgi:predicted N-acetyltransferase YhbS